MRYSKILVFIMIILIISLFYSITYSNTNKEYMSRKKIFSDKVIDNMINDVIRDQGIRDPVKLYEILYGGRILIINKNNYPEVLNKFRGADPLRIHIGAYYNNSWHELPLRIYDRKLVAAKTELYILPKLIDENTTIEFRLPPTPSQKINPVEKPPYFGRGSGGYVVLEIMFPRINIKTYIYVFLGSETYNDYVKAFTYEIRGEHYFDTSTYIPAINYFEKDRKLLIYRYGSEAYRELIETYQRRAFKMG
jgi:hypothetical protein